MARGGGEEGGHPYVTRRIHFFFLGRRWRWIEGDSCGRIAGASGGPRVVRWVGRASADGHGADRLPFEDDVIDAKKSGTCVDD